MSDETNPTATEEQTQQAYAHGVVSEIIARLDADKTRLQAELDAARHALFTEGIRTRGIENELARYKAAIPRTALELSESVDALNAKLMRAEAALAAEADTARLNWLDSQVWPDGKRTDLTPPIVQLVVKRFFNPHDEWANCAQNARKTIDAARAALAEKEGK